MSINQLKYKAYFHLKSFYLKAAFWLSGNRLRNLREMSFEKEGRRWYAVIPQWKGSKASLEMVAGADTFLDSLDIKNKGYVTLSISTKRKGGYRKLTKVDECKYGGANYIYKQPHKLPRVMWLCEVTLFVFGKYPENIYFRVVK